MAASLDAGRVDGRSVQQKQFHDRRGAHHAEVPVVLDGSAAFVGGVVGVAFNQDVQVGVLFKDFGKGLDGFDAVFRHRPACRGEEQFALHRNVDFAVACFDIQTFVGKSDQGVVERRAQLLQLAFLGSQCVTGVRLFLLQFGLFYAQRVFLLLEGLLFGRKGCFFVVELFGACCQQVVGAVQVLALSRQALGVVLDDGVKSHLLVFKGLAQGSDAVVLVVADVGQVGDFGAERLVLPLQVGILVAQVAKFALRRVEFATQLRIFRLEGFIFSKCHARTEQNGGDSNE